MAGKPCGLITIVPAALQPGWASRVAVLTKNFRPAALILQGLHLGASDLIVAEAKRLELAVLYADAPVEAHQAGADGVYFTSSGQDVSGARAMLGSASILGVGCAFSRHAAMESAEAGADFIAFDASIRERWDDTAALSVWWDEITGVPGALMCGSTRPPTSVLSLSSPDFLIVEDLGEAGESLTFATVSGLQSQT